MTWTELPARTAPVAKSKAPVVISCSAPGRYQQTLCLTVRPELLEGGLPFWKPEALLRVLIGSDAHEGMLRIEPGGTRPLRVFGAHGKATGVLSLCIPPPCRRHDSGEARQAGGGIRLQPRLAGDHAARLGAPARRGRAARASALSQRREFAKWGFPHRRDQKHRSRREVTRGTHLDHPPVKQNRG